VPAEQHGLLLLLLLLRHCCCEGVQAVVKEFKLLLMVLSCAICAFSAQLCHLSQVPDAHKPSCACRETFLRTCTYLLERGAGYRPLSHILQGTTHIPVKHIK
jgi:hypothetical protein